MAGQDSMSSVALGSLSKDFVTLEELGQVRSRGRLCDTSILMYNAGSNLRLFRSNFYNQRTDGTFKVHS